jgi:hypothetical protein
MRTRRSLKDSWSVRRVQTSCTQLLEYDHNLIPPRERRQFPNKFYRIYMTWVCFLEKGMGRGMKRYSTHSHPFLSYAFSTEGSFSGVVLQQRSVLAWGSISQNNAPHKRANINASPSPPQFTHPLPRQTLGTSSLEPRRLVSGGKPAAHAKTFERRSSTMLFHT